MVDRLTAGTFINYRYMVLCTLGEILAHLQHDPKRSWVSRPKISNRSFLIIFAVLTAAVIVDSQVGIVADFIVDSLVTASGLALFVGIAAIFIVTQHFILGYIRENNRQQRARALHLSITDVGVTAAQYVLAGIFVIVMVQMFATSQYHSAFLAASTSISFALLIVMFGLLTRAFLSWYRLSSTASKKNALMAIFAMAMTATLVYAVGAITLLLGMLQQQPEVIASDRVAMFPEFEPDTPYGQIQTWYGIAAAVAFALTWVGAVILLYPYSKKFGRAKFWAIMGFAIFYHTIQIPLFMLGWYTPSETSDAMTNILITSGAGIFTGIIFGAAFLSVARTLRKGTAVRNQMMLAAYGFLLLYVAGSGTASQAAYPPMGLACVSVMGLAAYMIYSGLYSSAITVSQDLELRQSIKRSVVEQSRMLDNIGTAQMQRELQGRVMTLAKKHSDEMAKETGLEPTMTEDDISDYMEVLVNELNQDRNRNAQASSSN